jgi:metal-responsive CopG/Arc/MetJ family transcriptional regulator
MDAINHPANAKGARMAEEKIQINFKTNADEAAAIDALAKIDGYDNRSAWVRTHLRQVINARRNELTQTLAPSGAQGVSVSQAQA